MTLASLIVKLDVDAAPFHSEMEKAARRVETTGRQMARAGTYISEAISLPILAVKAAAFAALLEDSARHFGPLYAATEALKERTKELFLAIGQQLQPVFLQIIQSTENLIAKIRSAVQWFSTLDPTVKKIVIDVLLFLGALGPALLMIGKVVEAVGGLMKVFSLATSPIGLVILAISALIAVAAYVVTHWTAVRVFFEKFWIDLKKLFQAGVDVLLQVLDYFLGAIPGLGDVIENVRKKFDAWMTGSIDASTQYMAKLEAGLKHTGAAVQGFGINLDTVGNIMPDLTSALQTSTVLGAALGMSFDSAGAKAGKYRSAIERLAKEFGPLLDQVQTLTHANLGQLFAESADQLRNYLSGKGFSGGQLDFIVALIQRLKDLAGAQAQLSESSRLEQAALGNLQQIYGSTAAAAAAYGRVLQQANGDEQRALRATQATLDIARDIQQGIVNALTAVGEKIGLIFANMSHGFSGLLKTLQGILGTMLETIGEALIASGVAGLHILSFITNPVGAIAAGVALVALGKTLSATAQSAVSSAGTALAGGGGGSASVGASAGGGGSSAAQGDVYVQMPPGPQLFDPRDAYQVDAFARFLQSLTDRRVILQTA